MAKVREEFNVPTHIRIGYRDYQVNYKPKSKSKALGQCNSDTGIIDIFNHRDAQALANTFLHEAFHAIYYEGNLDDRTGEEHEEDLVRTMADGFSAFFTNNPEAAIWLLQTFGVTNASIPDSPVGQVEAIYLRGSIAAPEPIGSV